MLFSLLLVALPTASTAYVSSLSPEAQDIFTESMQWLDYTYDPVASQLYDGSNAVALRHTTRGSPWYAVGLLARNEGDDVEQALNILTTTISLQYKDPKEQWFGSFPKGPEEPLIGAVYPPKIYSTWDPNRRGFVATAFIQALEEFPHLITPSVTELMLESLENATIGDSYRVGGVDGDNLYPAYSNPSIMRAFVSGWTGRRINDTNMTLAGEIYAQDIIHLFNLNNTLSEFNSPTYDGVSLFALCLWAKYLPEDSVMKQNGARMIVSLWDSLADFWHPELKNVAGPWDRAYGFDMNKYLSVVGMHIWSILGKTTSGVIEKTVNLSHNSDFTYGPLFAVMAAFHKSLIPTDTLTKFSEFAGERTISCSAFSPPFDTYPRNITTWLSSNISIGAETFDETVIGGPAINTGQFNPAVVQWKTGTEVGFISLYATEKALEAVVSPMSLNLTYTRGTSSSMFSLIVSTFKNKRNVASWEDVQGLSVKPSGNVNLNYTVGFAGSSGGSSSVINNFEFWNFTYRMPSEFTGKPNLFLEFEFK